MSKKSAVRIDPLTLALPHVGVDSHAHLDGQEFDADRDAVIERAHAAGIAQVATFFWGRTTTTHAAVFLMPTPTCFFSWASTPAMDKTARKTASMPCAPHLKQMRGLRPWAK